MIVLMVVLLLFGGAKLPKLARSLGEAQGEFRKAVKHGGNPVDEPVADTPPTPAS